MNHAEFAELLIAGAVVPPDTGGSAYIKHPENRLIKYCTYVEKDEAQEDGYNTGVVVLAGSGCCSSHADRREYQSLDEIPGIVEELEQLALGWLEHHSH